MGQRRRFSAAVVATALCTSLSAPVAAGAVEPPSGPSIAVDPSVDLVSGQSVEVTGAGFPANGSVGVVQCGGGAFDISGCDLGELRFPDTDEVGSFTTTISVRRRISVGGEILDCAAAPGTCVIGAASLSSMSTSATAPLAFDPDAPLPTEPTASVDPDIGLIDRQEVHVWGGGFGPEAPLMVAQCPAGADPEACNIRTGEMTDLDGLFGANLGVRRVLTDGEAFLDCASAVGACEIVVFDQDDPSQIARVPVSFDPAGPMPMPATIAVEPSTDLLDDQEVAVTGESFEVGAWAELSLCKLEGGAPGYLCEWLTSGESPIDASGDLAASVNLPRRIFNWDGDPVDCAIDECAVVVDAYGYFHDRAFAPVSFDPEAPLPDPPSLVVDPDDGLVDRQLVSVEGSGFAPGTYVEVAQCTMRPDSYRACSYTGAGELVADESGEISGQLRIRRLMDLAGSGYEGGGGAEGLARGDGVAPAATAVGPAVDVPEAVDCADAPGTCHVYARSYDDPFARVIVPLSFDAAVPPSPPPTAVADPSTGLADLQVIDVTGEGFAPGDGVIVRQCADVPEWGRACRWGTDSTATAGDDGSVSAELRLRRTIPIFGGEWEGEGAAAAGPASAMARAEPTDRSALAGSARATADFTEMLVEAADADSSVVDCADAPGRCYVEVVASDYALDRAVAPISFDPEAPPFPLPTLVADPSTDLADRQSVHVAGDGYLPGEMVWIQECAASADPDFPPNPCRSVGMFVTDATGNIGGDVTVRRLLGSMSSDPVDCASTGGRCLLRVSVSWLDTGELPMAPLSFDPESPIVLPVLTVTPEVGLADGQTVDVHGTGYSPGAWIGLVQCRGEALSATGCDLSQIGYAYADGAGVLDTTFDVHSTIHVGGDTIDCAAVPGSCVVGAANISDYAEGAKDHLTFGAPPVATPGDVEVSEGDDGPVTVELPIGLSGPSQAPVSVHWELVGGSAAGGSDFLGTGVAGAPATMSGDVTFEPGSTQAVVPLAITGDALDEDDETFELALSSPRHAAVSQESGVVTILDDDDPPVVAAGMAGVWEGGRHDDTVVEIPVFLSAPSGKRVTVDVRTRGWTARRHRDFEPVDVVVTFEPGEVRKVVEVPIVGDRRPEPLEAFLVKLRNAQDAEIGGLLGLGLALIWDDDAPHDH